MRKNIAASFLLLLCAGCGTTPEPDYYTLSDFTGTPQATVASLKIERPVLPEYLDRPDIVRQNGANQVTIDESRRWAEPLDTMTESILADDVRQRLPSSQIVTEHENTAAKTRLTLELNIENFNATDKGAVLRAHLTFADAEGCAKPMPFETNFSASTHGNGPEALSELLGKLADAVTEATTTLTAEQCAAP